MEANNTEKYHNLQNVVVIDNILSFDLESKHYSFSLTDLSKVLADATRLEREIFRVSPSGYGIHWPLIDEDLSIDGLLGIRHDRDEKANSVRNLQIPS